MAHNGKQVVVVTPAFNEAESISDVVSDLVGLTCDKTREPLIDQVIVADNGSNDGTGYLAREAGAVVVRENRKGYGFACLAGLRQLKKEPNVRPEYVVFVDADGSVDANEIPRLLNALTAGDDLVVGHRVQDLQQAGALNPHQRAGTALACWLIRMLWRVQVRDLGPLRAIRYTALELLDMQDPRFGWTVEMQVKALQLGLNYSEVPVTTRARVGESKISGTLLGTVGAARGIFGKIFSLYLHQTEFIYSVRSSRST